MNLLRTAILRIAFFCPFCLGRSSFNFLFTWFSKTFFYSLFWENFQIRQINVAPFIPVAKWLYHAYFNFLFKSKKTQIRMISQYSNFKSRCEMAEPLVLSMTTGNFRYVQPIAIRQNRVLSFIWQKLLTYICHCYVWS